MSRQLTNRDKLSFHLDHLSESEIQEVLDYVSIMETMKREAAQPEVFEDELLTLLSASVENRRARQVYEWDAIRKRSDARVAIPPNPRRAARASASR